MDAKMSRFLVACLVAAGLSACQPTLPVASSLPLVPSNPAASVTTPGAPFAIAVAARPSGVVRLGTAVEIDVIS